MNSPLRPCLVLLLALGSTALFAESTDEAWRAELHKVGDEYTRAMNEGKPAQFEPYLADDFTMVTLTNEEIKGAEGVRAYWARILKKMGPGAKYSVSLQYTPSEFHGNFAVMHGSTEDVVETPAHTFRFSSHWTAFGERTDKGWRVHRIHASMDPINNAFVRARQAASNFVGILSTICGLVLGASVAMLLNKFRKKA